MVATAVWSMAAGVLALAAFLPKEEVVALPMIFTIWIVINRSSLRAVIGRPNVSSTWIAR